MRACPWRCLPAQLAKIAAFSSTATALSRLRCNAGPRIGELHRGRVGERPGKRRAIGFISLHPCLRHSQPTLSDALSSVGRESGAATCETRNTVSSHYGNHFQLCCSALEEEDDEHLHHIQQGHQRGVLFKYIASYAANVQLEHKNIRPWTSRTGFKNASYFSLHDTPCVDLGVVETAS
jgi:hypothetical protein